VLFFVRSFVLILCKLIEERERTMFRMASVTELRDKLAETIESLEEQKAIMVLRHNRPAAYLVSPELFEGLLEQIEDLVDLRDMGAAVEDYRKGEAVDGEEVFGRLGL
jgi:PHD/YefM family antitoxin component YafN of YafNO toxin-antitoxin module